MSKFMDSMALLADFFREQKLVPQLALRAGCSTDTVYNTFKSQKKSDLKGPRFIVWQEAVKMKEEFDAVELTTAEIFRKE